MWAGSYQVRKLLHLGFQFSLPGLVGGVIGQQLPRLLQTQDPEAGWPNSSAAPNNMPVITIRFNLFSFIQEIVFVFIVFNISKLAHHLQFCFVMQPADTPEVAVNKGHPHAAPAGRTYRCAHPYSRAASRLSVPYSVDERYPGEAFPERDRASHQSLPQVYRGQALPDHHLQQLLPWR